MNKKSYSFDLDTFIIMLQMCPKLPGQKFIDPPFEEDILTFKRELSYSSNIKFLSDKVDYVYLLWEDLVFQIENKESRKNKYMFYHRFTKVIINHFMSQDQSIPRRNKVDWHMLIDDPLLTTMRFIPQHEVVQKYDAILPDYLTTQTMKESKTEQAPKPFLGKSVKAMAKVETSGKKKQPTLGLETLTEVALTEHEQLKLAIKRSLIQTHSSHASRSGAHEGTCVKPGVLDVPTYRSDEEEIYWKSSDEEDDDDEENIGKEEDDNDQEDDDNTDHDDDKVNEEESFDPIVQTPSQVESTDDEDNDNDSHGMNVKGDKLDDEGANEEDDGNELYKDVNINLEGQDIQMEDVQTTQVIEDTHVTLTPVNLEDVSVTTTAESPLLSAITLPLPSIPIIPHLQQTHVPSPANVLRSSLQDLPNFGSLFRFDHRLKTLEVNFSEFMQTNLFAEAISLILGIVDKYIDNRVNEAVKVAVQLQLDRLRDEAQAENEDLFNKLDENIQKIIKEQVKEQVKAQVFKILPKIEKTVNEQLKAKVLTHSSHSSKTSHAIAANLSELELKKIFNYKTESNKAIHRSNEQKNLYKALVDAYECDKLILETYIDTITLKRRQDDDDKDEEPYAGSNRGSKKRRAGKEQESTSAPKELTSKTTGKSTDGSKSHHKSASEFAQAEEPMHTTKDLEEPTHQEFNTDNSHTSFNELMDTPLDFSAFVMNRLKVDTLTPKLLVGPTYEMMKRSCKSLVELEFFLEEVYKASTDQLELNNPEGQQYPHDLEYARDVYSKCRIIAVTELQIVEWHNYKHLDWITVRRDDDKLYKSKKGDYNRLRIQDIEYMLLFLVQGKLTNLIVDERLALKSPCKCLREASSSNDAWKIYN
nr:hypothetical protein [Tanacetum cinerariifolium]